MADANGYVNFDVAVETVPTGHVSRVLSSPAGEASAEFALPFAEHELENLVLRLGVPRRTRKLWTAHGPTAKQLGDGLYRALFTDDVGEALSRSLDAAAAKGAGLRIRLRLANAPELVDLPWEFLYDERRDQFLALSDQTPIVRYLDQSGSLDRSPGTGPLRILAVIPQIDAATSDFEPLDVDAEWDNVNEALGGLVASGRAIVERLNPCTMDNLQSVLLRGEYDVFHFVGHGGYDAAHEEGVLLFADADGRDDVIAAEHLAVLLNDHRSLRLAFLNACDGGRTSSEHIYTGTAQRLVQKGLPAVVAMQFPITDGAAIVTATRFYEAVADGLGVDGALCEARKGLFSDGNEVEWATPVLYLRSDDTRLFDPITSASAPPAPAVVPPAPPAPPPPAAPPTAAPPTATAAPVARAATPPAPRLATVATTCQATLTRQPGGAPRRDEVANIVLKWLGLQGCAVEATRQPDVTTVVGVIGSDAVRVILSVAGDDLWSEVAGEPWNGPVPTLQMQGLPEVTLGLGPRTAAEILPAAATLVAALLSASAPPTAVQAPAPEPDVPSPAAGVSQRSPAGGNGESGAAFYDETLG